MRRWLAVLLPLAFAATPLVIAKLYLAPSAVGSFPLIALGVLVGGTIIVALLTRNSRQWRFMLAITLCILAGIEFLVVEGWLFIAFLVTHDKG